MFKKSFFFSLLIGFVAVSVQAQIATPQPSPKSTINQKVGLTDVTLVYSRPSVKDRIIWGDLVPYNEIWRTGANDATKIKFSDDVLIEGMPLKAGEYSLYTKPTPTTWEVYFYKDLTSWGVPEEWKEDQIAIRFTVTPQALPMKMETLLLSFDDVKINSTTLNIYWDKLMIPIRFKFDPDSKVEKDIAKVLGGPVAADFYQAGRYYFDSGKDINKAYEWVSKANTMDPKFWTLRLEALILAKMGKYKQAIEVAKKSTELAVVEKNTDYQRMNAKDIAEWSKK